MVSRIIDYIDIGIVVEIIQIVYSSSAGRGIDEEDGISFW